MTKSPPERFTVSLPADVDLDLDQLDDLVRESEYGSRSEYIRQAILDGDVDEAIDEDDADS